VDPKEARRERRDAHRAAARARRGEGGPARRRRGAELEEAILDAAWEQLAEAGYGGFTFEAIAERARTSKPVLYRRWPTRSALLLAAFRRRGERTRFPTPDTGSLRGDVVAVLRQVQRSRAELFALVAASAGLAFELDVSPAEVRAALVGTAPSHMRLILERAVERGEAGPAALHPRVVSLPMDLMRGEGIMTLKPVPTRAIEEIVDEVFLPLVRARSAPGARGDA